MKILLTFLLFQSLLPTPIISTSDTNCKKIIIENNDIESELAKKIQGHWYSAEYLHAIEQNQSIIGVKEFPTTTLGLIIQADENNPKKLLTYGHNFSESGVLDAVLKFDSKKKTFVNNIKASTSFKESFIVNLIDDNTIELQFANHTELYKRVDDIEVFFRKSLIAGEFTVDEDIVKLSESGRVENFKNYKYYTVDHSINNMSNLMSELGADIVYFLPEKEASILETDIYTMRVRGHKIILQKLILIEGLEDNSEEIYRKDGAEIILMKK